MPELRECPFCGGELTCVSGTGVDLMTQDNRPYIGCKVCEWTLSGRRLTEIAKIINCRPTEDALRARIGELEGLVADAIKFMDSEEACQGGFCDECEASIGECLVVRLKDALNKEAFTAAGEEGER